jgi:hypothetical protein
MSSLCTVRFITASYASGIGNRHVPPTGNATLTAFPASSTSHTTGVGMLETVGHSPNHGDLRESRLNWATTCTMSPVRTVCERIASLKSSVYLMNWHTSTDVGSGQCGSLFRSTPPRRFRSPDHHFLTDSALGEDATVCGWRISSRRVARPRPSHPATASTLSVSTAHRHLSPRWFPCHRSSQRGWWRRSVCSSPVRECPHPTR